MVSTPAGQGSSAYVFDVELFCVSGTVVSTPSRQLCSLDGGSYFVLWCYSGALLGLLPGPMSRLLRKSCQRRYKKEDSLGIQSSFNGILRESYKWNIFEYCHFLPDCIWVYF